MKFWSILCAVALCVFPLRAQVNNTELNDPKPGDQTVWTSVSDVKLGWGSRDVRYSRSQVPTFEKKLTLRAWRGERVSAQALLVSPKELKNVTFQVSDLKSGKNKIDASAVRKYFVRYVMGDEYANKAGKKASGYHEKWEMDSFLLADRLDPVKQLDVAAHTTRPLWLDIRVPANAVAGKYTGTLSVSAEGKDWSIPYTLEVTDRVLPAPKDWKFHLDLWQNPYAVARYYQVPLWSKEHFDLMRPMMTLLAEAGQKVITTSIIQRPWNGQTEDPFCSMIAKIKKLDGSWLYDYSVFDRWVEFMMSCGITEQIDCYTLVPWNYTFDYYDLSTNEVKHIACKPGTPEYHDYTYNFLKDFAAHLKSKGWFSKTCIAMDERPMDQMQAVYNIVKEADKDYRIAGAFNYFPDVVKNVHDASVAFQFNLIDQKTIDERHQKGDYVTFYTCCGPHHPNTFTFSPSAESAFLGWHSVAVNYDGYLRWAYCSWNKQPCQDSRFRTWASGDCYLVYPDGSSIRFEQMVRGIQAYEKVRILQKELTGKKLEKLNQLLQPFRVIKLEESQDVAKMVEQAEFQLKMLE